MLKKTEGFEGYGGKMFPTRKAAAENLLTNRLGEAMFAHRNDKIMEEGRLCQLNPAVLGEASAFAAVLISLFPTEIEALIHQFYEDLKDTDNPVPAKKDATND